ncbi:MAG TPA: c-type cytochrome biogenesis protein CcsB [Bacteroidales bacterium]|nr:c-type cytochrome biogenesis protein CcsB [Bacteroidales bacterium]
MKIVKFLFSPVLMGILFVLFAVAMAVATFVENDFGASFAYSMVYNSKWFELILLLLATNLIGQLIILKLYKRRKLPVFLFHLAFILMILGAGITRYFGWEGTLHIREGEEQNRCLSNEKYIGYSVKDSNGKIIDSHSENYSMTSVSADNYKKRLTIDNKDYELVLAKIIPNATEIVSDSPEGEPVVSLFVTKDMMDRETIILKQGDTKSAYGIAIGFAPADPAEVNISFESGNFLISSKYDLGEMSMKTKEVTLSGIDTLIPLKLMQILTVKDIKIVPQEISMAGIIKAVAANPEEQNTGQNAFIFHLSDGKESETVYLWDRNTEKVATGSCSIGGNIVELNYGSQSTILPFSIKLNDFILDRYPGSNSPSGYKSDVVLLDQKENVEKPFMIFMNNILKYKGYRFYQSSYDHDEKGTILSVNHDMAGMFVTYSGYALLFVFIILSLLNKNSVFHNIDARYWQSSIRKTIPLIIFFLFISGLTSANGQKLVPDNSVSEEFGRVLVQDQKGRTKPLFTLSNDIMRKVTRENKFEGFTSMQVFLGLYLDFNNWKEVPMIKVSNKDLQSRLGIRGKYASFSDLVNLDGKGGYKISKEVNDAYSKAPGERSKEEKEVIKVDERVNIVYMIYKGDFLKLFPLKNGTHDWGSPEDALQKAVSKDDSLYLNNIIPVLADALQTNNITTTRQVTESISSYQSRFSEYDLPSETKTNAELFYYKLSIFERLFPFYATVGLIMLISLIVMVIRGRIVVSLFVRIFSWLLFTGFLLHTFGLGLRWYIAGHSPMSNGYESMIFISWVTLLAGFIFSRKSAFALSATAVLASMTLMVAHLSFMDPEITNLVPVLQSYWLTLHVSVITGSYGFLGLGAILGLITMMLLLFSNKKNQERISNTIDDLTVINFKTLTLGLYFLTIGTFLGAVWANESWGRYWGWDPKETWSLITIVIYSIAIHSRMIPGMKDIFIFNLISLFAFSSVLMTYFGVNYYLSGLHSYAAGDPVPIPSFVYITVFLLTTISFVAYFKYTKWNKGVEKQE